MTSKYFSACENADALRTRYEEINTIFNLQALPDGSFKREVEDEYRAMMLSFSSQLNKPAVEAEKYSIEQIQQLVKSNNLQAERIGKWIWVSNLGLNGRSIEMKKMGFRYSASKQRWYWRSDQDKSSNPNPLPLDEIRRRYGAKQIVANL